MGDRVGEQFGGLGQRGRAHRRGTAGRVSPQRGLPERERHGAAGRAVPGDRDRGQPGQPRGGTRRVADRRRREHERGRTAVAGRQPPQASHHVGDLGAEHAAVRVALVHDHVGEAAQECAPGAVPGQDRVVQHVRIGEHDAGVLAYPLPLLARRVPVVTRRPYSRQIQLGDGAQLVGGQRLRRRQVQHRRPRVGEQPGQRGKLVGQRLAGRGAGRHHDVRTVPGQVGGVGLVPPRCRDPAGRERAAQLRRYPRGPVDGLAGAGRYPFDVGDGVGSGETEVVQEAVQLLRGQDARHAVHSGT